MLNKLRLYFAMLVCFIVCPLALRDGLEEKAELDEIAKEGVTVPAVIVKAKVYEGRNSDEFYVDVRFTTHRGNEVTRHFSVEQEFFDARVDKGVITKPECQVRYIPDDRDLIVLVDGSKNDLVAIPIGIGAGIIGLCLTFFFVIRPRMRAKHLREQPHAYFPSAMGMPSKVVATSQPSKTEETEQAEAQPEIFDPHAMTPDKWAGAVYGALVCAPAVIMAKEGFELFSLMNTLWMLVPVLGGLLAGFLLRRGWYVTLLSSLSAYSSVWCVASWSGSRNSAFEGMVAAGVGVFPFFIIYLMYKRFSKIAPKSSTPVLSNNPMTFGQVIGTYWPQILLAGSAFLGITLWTIHDLNQLESGVLKNVRLWAPIVSFYEQFGYWPAVLFTPALGLLCGWALCSRLMKTGRIQP